MAVIGHILGVVAFVALVYTNTETADMEKLIRDDQRENQTSRVPRQLAVLPNGAQCFKNLDCASGCCLLESCFIGICIAEAQKGQICGLLSTNPWGPPGFLSHLPEIIGGPGI